MTEIVAATPKHCQRAAEILMQGGIVAVPTDTFYGLAVNAFDVKAVERLFSLKGRSPDTPIPLLIRKLTDIGPLTEGVCDYALPLARRVWPGPVTLVLPASDQVPDAITANTRRVGLRIARHGVLAQLLSFCRTPVTGTSANRSGDPPSRTVTAVQTAFPDGVDLILDGGVSPGRAGSTVVDCREEGPVVLREGAVGAPEIEALVAELRGEGA